MNYTLVQLHFVRGIINHRLRFGQPETKTELDKYRSLASFPEGSIFGYIRWRANEYGTIEWRTYVLKAQSGGYISHVAVSYTHLRAHETREDLVCRLLLEKKKK